MGACVLTEQIKPHVDKIVVLYNSGCHLSKNLIQAHMRLVEFAEPAAYGICQAAFVEWERKYLLCPPNQPEGEK